jgi:NADH dehydrogenase
VLPPFPPDLSAKAEKQLMALGVRPIAGARVTNIDDRGVTVKTAGGGEDRVETHTVLWAAGVRASRLGKVLAERAGAPLDNVGRVMVEPDLSVPGHPEIHVIGDLANFSHQTGKPLPGVAPVAMSQGRYVADLIVRKVRGEPAKPFHYFDKGNLATVGRNKAVAQFGKLHIAGFAAWFLWVFVHLMYLVEFENRVLVLVEWVYNYITRNRGARLITGGEPH